MVSVQVFNGQAQELLVPHENMSQAVMIVGPTSTYVNRQDLRDAW